MKPRTFIMPPPLENQPWLDICREYNLPEPDIYDKVCCRVTLPAGWFVLPKEDSPDNYEIFNEDCQRVGAYYLTEMIGFTVITGLAADEK